MHLIFPFSPFNPLNCHWGGRKMTHRFFLSPTAHQSGPLWPLECLVQECAINISYAKDWTTQAGYSSALQSYIHFCHIHDFNINPTTNTLLLFIAWLCTFIKPKSVGTYLSRICAKLEDMYPDVQANWKSPLVKNTLRGASKHFGMDMNWKDPLAIEHIIRVAESLGNNPSFDDSLFLMILLCAFFGIHRLGELVDHDKPSLQDSNKTIKRLSVKFYENNECLSYWLPKHKADILFARSEVIIKAFHESFDPVPFIIKYISSRDHRFPLHFQLFLTSTGVSPTRGWFMHHLKVHFNGNIGGHSPCTGSMTYLAMLGWARELIQRASWWRSEAFEMYVRKNPVLLQAFISAGCVPRVHQA